MDRTSRRAWILVGLAVIGALPPYAGPALGFDLATREIVEVVDHVLPAVAVVAVGAAGVLRGRIGLVGAVIAFLAGVWMAGTHVPLLLQAVRDEVDVPTALFHATPGLAVLVAGALALFVWTVQEERLHSGAAADRGLSG